MPQAKRPHRRKTPTAKREPGAALTVAEAADLLGVSPNTVYRWIASGAIPAWRVGPRFVRIPRKWIDAQLDGAKARKTTRRKRAS
jgi:excisionase family DNA binding protein